MFELEDVEVEGRGCGIRSSKHPYTEPKETEELAEERLLLNNFIFVKLIMKSLENE